MRSKFLGILAISAGAMAGVSVPSADATEICGDGIDNNNDGQADEGCYPTGVTGICESPLSCASAGAVAPRTGALVYHMPPDLAPTVPYGPSIAFQRLYTSKYTQTLGPTNYRAPLGHRWQHNYMSWLEKFSDPTHVVLHNTNGQDIRFDYDSTDGGWDYYTPQPGYHFDHLRQKTTGDREWQIRTLTGSVYEYDWDDPVGKLVAIKDSLATPNVVTITYNGDGQVDTITDASGKKFLKLEYQTSGNKYLRYVKYYTTNGTTDTLRATVEYTIPSSGGSANHITAVVLDSATIQTYSYASGFLTNIASGDKDVANFSYISNSDGSIARIATAEGMVGYDYDGDETECPDGTFVYYHRTLNASGGDSCSSDAGCATGAYCGGQLAKGAPPVHLPSGLCYRVRRCLLVSSPNEDLVDAVSSVADGASCPSCVGTQEYAWDTGSSDEKIDLAGVKSATGIWTSYERNANGLVTKMVENDDDADASTVPGGARVTYFFYGNTSFPGRVTEIRRLSELHPTGTCTDSTTTHCKRTIYIYDSDGLLESVEEKGFTYDDTATVTAFSYLTEHTYDSKGRLLETDGPLSGSDDVTEYTYWSTSDELKDGYLKEIKRKVDSSNYLVTTLDEYDVWGNARRTENPDGNLTCRTWHASHNRLTEERIAMDGQTTCASADSSDLVTTYTRDDYGRLTKVEFPAGYCYHYEYDSRGRVAKVKSRDDCNPASSGDTIEYTYDARGNGLLTKVEYKDASDTVTYRQQYDHHADRRLEHVFDPEHEFPRTWEYYADGMPKKVTFEIASQATEWLYDAFNREQERRRHYSAGAGPVYDTWEMLRGLFLVRPTEVKDEDDLAIEWVRDDLGRKVSQTTPDSGTTLHVYDAASNLVTSIEALGTAGEVTHSFTYDHIGRILTEDYGVIDCGINQEPEIQYTYDSGDCPIADCNQAGRLAEVKVTMFCDDSQGDDTFDQTTVYRYDPAGRLVYEDISDDGSRSAAIEYDWTGKRSHPQKIIAPSGTAAGWSFDGGSNSDKDKIVEMWRNTPSTGMIADRATWLPFGPMGEYHHKNAIGSQLVGVVFSWDLAYRPTELSYDVAFSPPLFEISYEHDQRGRITSRVFAGADSSVQDAYYTYDGLGRILCDSAASGACPTFGSDQKTTISGSPPYSKSGNRNGVIFFDGFLDYAYQYVTGSNQIDEITGGFTYNSADQEISYAWDHRGNRIAEDDARLDNDEREFTYDGRNNVRTVTGKLYPGDTPLVWEDYVQTSAYDHKNRRIFKSLLNEETEVEEHWFYYYDLYDRLIEVKHTPDISDTDTYSIFQFYWIHDRPVAYWQVNYPGASATARYYHADEINRPFEVWTWPASGDAQRIWSLIPDLFGWHNWTASEELYQPLLFPGQYFDAETAVWGGVDDELVGRFRPSLHYNHHRAYDPFTGTYLQVDPRVEDTWEGYSYVMQNPVMRTDRTGLAPDDGQGGGCRPGYSKNHEGECVINGLSIITGRSVFEGTLADEDCDMLGLLGLGVPDCTPDDPFDDGGGGGGGGGDGLKWSGTRGSGEHKIDGVDVCRLGERICQRATCQAAYEGAGRAIQGGADLDLRELDQILDACMKRCRDGRRACDREGFTGTWW